MAKATRRKTWKRKSWRRSRRSRDPDKVIDTRRQSDATEVEGDIEGVVEGDIEGDIEGVRG